MELDLTNVAIVPVVVGIVSALKTLGLSTRYAPVASIVVGVIMVMLFDGFNVGSALTGVVTGLSAAGLYSGTKTTFSM